MKKPMCSYSSPLPLSTPETYVTNEPWSNWKRFRHQFAGDYTPGAETEPASVSSCLRKATIIGFRFLRGLMSIPFFQVDAFTDQAFAGNPAAVCLLSSWPD